jgi:hypothetical protein
VSKIIESFGYNFGLTHETSVDTLYKNTTHDSFYQSKKLHLYLASIGVIDFSQRHITGFDEQLLDFQAIKEPYLVGILDSIRHLIGKIILVVRNPNDVINSINKFYKDNLSNEKTTIKNWVKYYTTFINSIGDVPYEVVNYDILLKSPEKVLTNLSNFLGRDTTDVSVQLNKKPQTTLVNLDVDTMFIYKSLTEKMHIETIKKNLLFNQTTKSCFCGSGRKYKKCCRMYSV